MTPSFSGIVFSLRVASALKFLSCLLFVLAGSGVQAEASGFEANPQDLLDRALQRHLAQEFFSGRSLSLSAETTFYWGPEEPFEKARQQVGRMRFQLAHLKQRPPADYSLLIDHARSDANFGERIGRRALWRLGENAFSGFIDTLSRKLQERTLSAAQFHTEFTAAASRLLEGDEPNLVFQALVTRAQLFGTLSWGLGRLRLIETQELPNDEKLHCIGAFLMPETKPVVVWICEPSLRVERVVMLRSGPMERETDGVRVISLQYHETFYEYDESPLLRDEDFAAPSGEPEDLLLTRHTSRFLGPAKALSGILPQIEAQIPSVQRARHERERLEKEAARAKGTAPRFPQPASSNIDPALLKGVVIIEGDESVGTGFVTKIRDVDFVVTSLHVLASNTTVRLRSMDGGTLDYTAIYGAVGRDVALFKIARQQNGLKLAENLVEVAQVGKTVRVVGNYNGGGVANQVTGVVKGVGPDRIEVDAPFAPGNSGSPIVCLESGVVFGVASYRSEEVDYSKLKALSDWNDLKPSVSRWFGYRLDGPVKWELIELSRWNEQYRRVADFNALSMGLVTAVTRGTSTPGSIRGCCLC